MRRLGSVLWGFVFILLGLIIGLNAMGITDINLFFRGWWTLLIIIPCFIGLFRNDNKTGDGIGLIIGIVLLLCTQGILEFRIIGKLIFPFILIMIGISILFRDTIHRKTVEKIKKLNAERKDAESFCATFGEINQNFAKQEFKGANVEAIFGSVNLDLKEAQIHHDEIINSNAIFGGIKIITPAGINVKVKSTPIFGGVENKVSTKFDEKLPTLYINSFCLFGGVDIR